MADLNLNGDGWDDWGLSPFVSHALSRLAQVFSHSDCGEPRVKANNVHVISQISACIVCYCCIDHSKWHGQTENYWVRALQSPDIGRGLIRAIKAVTVQHHRKIQPDQWWHCRIFTSFRTLITVKRIAPVCNVILTALGFPREPWLLPALFSPSDVNWLFVPTAALDCWSTHATVRAQSKSPVSPCATLASFPCVF